MKKTIRSLLGLLLVLCMTLSLAACGGKEDTPQGQEQHPEMVYTAKSEKIDTTQAEEGISPTAYTDDGFYGVSYGKVADGVLPEGAVVEWEGQYDVYGYRLFFVGYDGTVRELSEYTPLEPTEDPGDKTNFSSGSNLATMFVDENGDLTLVENLYTNWFDGTEDELNSNTWDDAFWEKYKSVSEYYIRKLDPQGKELSSVKLDFNTENAWLDFYRCVFDSEGNMIVLGDQTLYAFAPDGSLKFQMETELWPNSIVKLLDGTIAVAAWGDNDLELYPLDLQKRSFGTPSKLPSQANDLLPGGGEYDFCYRNGMYLYGYKVETEENTKIINWMDVDINGNNVSGFVLKPDGSIVCVINTWKGDRTDCEVATITKVPYDSVPHKETLTMAVMYSGDVFDKVIDFNRHSDTVRIQLLDYSEYNDYENGDYDAGRTKLLTEILSGEVPDIIALNQLPYQQFASKGLLEDLYPYFDSDPELNREDFFSNVFQALEVDGKLYEVTPSFNVQTLIGAASVVGKKPGWTYEDLQAALATMPEGCDPLDMYTTREDMLRILVYADLDHFVDWTNGKCSFENDDFIQLLEFAAMFPDSIPDDVEWESPSDRIAQGRQMLSTAYLYSVDSMLYNDVQFGESGCTFIGYPTNNGVGSMMSLDAGYGISARCQHKEEAWEFLRSFLLEEAQESVWGIPVSLKAYQKQLEAAMTPEYEMDENGKIKLDEEGNKVQIPRTSYWDETGEHPIYAMTQEQADKLWEAVTTCTKVMNFDDSIFDIVYEQAQAYFAGQKSAQDVARLIQSKVTIYVNEQR